MTDKQPSALDRQKIVATRLTSAVNLLMASREGREYIWWLLSISKIGNQPFSSDPLQMAFNCGELNVGNTVLAHLLENCPDGYMQMQKEQADDDRTYSNVLYSDD